MSQSLLSMKKEEEHALLMKILGNATRLTILKVIYASKEDLCVNQIASRVGISQSLASHQLAYLSAHGVVENHRMGQTMCYVPAKNELSHIVVKILKILSL